MLKEMVAKLFDISVVISKSEKTNSITLVMPLDMFIKIKKELKD